MLGVKTTFARPMSSRAEKARIHVVGLRHHPLDSGNAPRLHAKRAPDRAASVGDDRSAALECSTALKPQEDKSLLVKLNSNELDCDAFFPHP